MVAPVASDNELTKVYLPEGSWYDLFTDDQHNGNQVVVADCPKERLPLYVRGGSILPMQSLVQSMQEQPDDTLRLHIYKGNGTSSYHYYEDDGATYAYESGNSHERLIELDSAKNKLTLHPVKGNFASHFKNIRVYFHGFGELRGPVIWNDGTAQPSTQELAFAQPIAGIDTFFGIKGEDMKIPAISVADVPNSNEQLVISW